MTLIAVMPYGGRCPNVGRLEAGPKMEVGPHLGPSMVWERVGLSSQPL